MSLDVFAPAIAASDQNVAQNAARDLPAEFSESFDVSTRSLSEWNSGVAYNSARDRALASYYDDVKQRTGVQLPLYGMGGNVSLEDLNIGIGKVAQDHPDQGFLPISAADIDTMARRRMAKAHDDAAAFANRETTWGGTAGTIAGTLIGGLSDPVTLATLPLGGAGELGIALRALEFAGISAGTEAVNAGMSFSSREAAVPGSSKEIPGEIVGAAGAGAVLGGAFGVLGKLLGHGAKTLPTSLRDDVNAATSEFQFHATNPFPTAAGETAARDATVEATTSLAKGETVTAGDGFNESVIYSNLDNQIEAARSALASANKMERFEEAAAIGARLDELIKTRQFATGHVADYALAAKAKAPEELALAGEQHLRPETFSEVPDVERFDRMPGETDDAASYWDKKLAAASPEERAALGATDVPLVVARQMPDGTIRYGEPGQIHADLIAANHFETHAAPPPRDSMGFAQPGGPFMSRDEATAFLDKNHPEISAKVDGIRDGAKRQIEAGQLNRAIGAEKPQPISASDLTPAQVTKLAADPATDSAVLHNLEHIMLEKPDAEFSTQVRQADGSYQIVTQKLSDVMAELDGMEAAGKELEACAAGLAMAAE